MYRDLSNEKRKDEFMQRLNKEIGLVNDESVNDGEEDKKVVYLALWCRGGFDMTHCYWDTGLKRLNDLLGELNTAPEQKNEILDLLADRIGRQHPTEQIVLLETEVLSQEAIVRFDVSLI
jgi:hypothetical protein